MTSPQLQRSVLFAAFRYALGRSTYIVSEITQALIEDAKVLGESNREIITKEIREAITNNHAGMDMDVEEWEKVIKYFADCSVEERDARSKIWKIKANIAADGNVIKSIGSMNDAAKGPRLLEIAEGMQALLNLNGPMVSHEALKMTVRELRVPLLDARYALTYARSEKMVEYDSTYKLLVALD